MKSSITLIELLKRGYFPKHSAITRFRILEGQISQKRRINKEKILMRDVLAQFLQTTLQEELISNWSVNSFIVNVYEDFF